MYKKVPTAINSLENEKEVLRYWKANDIFEQSIENRKDRETYTFYDGPPTANGKPHVGHVLTRAIKDLIPRYKTMKGYKVMRKAGWDTHGLPVELEVEKLLGIDGKTEIERYGVENFNQTCKNSVWKYKQEWEQMSEQIGYWADMAEPYVTYDDKYIESVWWAIKKIWESGLLYKGHKIMPYCPRCGTSLSSHEVSQGYKKVTEKSVYVKFPVKGRENVFLLAWTTTPWTLPSNSALTVHPEIDYIEAQAGEEILILSKEIAKSLLEDYQEKQTMKGKELFGLEYENLFNFAKTEKKAWYVVTDDFVTTTDGTGIVHTAPAFGEDDAKVGRKFDLPFIQLVDAKGCFLENMGELSGMFVKKADPIIIKQLKLRNLIFKIKEYEHTYPFCWRCDTPLLYYAMDTWFVKMTAVKDKLIANNNSINWLPENIKDGRMGNFLSNVVDWGLSRSRYWGTPLPIWECQCGDFQVVGSKSELLDLGKKTEQNIELHRPYVDEVKIKCKKCGSLTKRVPDVLDCWFDSGSMPFAQWHYPFENEETFEQNFPADFISEAIDQTRGWFYTLLAISTVLFGKAPFKNCIVLGHVNDKNGVKMSKHKGNVVDPQIIINKQGADAIRWYFYVSSSPWVPKRFFEDAIDEVKRKFIGTLWSVYAFYVLYADIDNFDATKFDINKIDSLNLMDRWILSELNTLVKNADDYLERYKITEAAREIQDFVDKLSNWYVRRCRERYWKNQESADKIAAYTTLYTVLVCCTKLLAPFVPFISEKIYQNLVLSLNKQAPKSVHLCDYPTCNERFINHDIQAGMNLVLNIVKLGRACRNKAEIKNRQPLKIMYIKASSTLPDEYLLLIKQELNIKNIEYTESTDDFVSYKFKPQLKLVGPEYGKFLPQISKFLSDINDGKEVMAQLKKDGFIKFNCEGTEIKLKESHLIISEQDSPGFVFEKENDISVVIDIKLSSDLIEEGFTREIVNKIQTMRKEAGYEVTDRINVYYCSLDTLAETVSKNINTIGNEVLADKIARQQTETFDSQCYQKSWNVNGESIAIAIEKNSG